MSAIPPAEVEGAPRYRRVDEARIVESLLVDGWADQIRLGRREAAAAEARAALQRCVDLGLPFALAPDGGRLFDPVEAENFLEWADLNGLDAAWERRCVAVARARAWEAYGGPESSAPPPPPAALPPRRYRVRLTRAFNLAGRP
ncbi:MAG TPA: hypothetical protein VG939_08130, partial [Caulobacteraceae bacterium]|nr:hypothetical protein [Caulobacteraceae bacterium]